MIIAKREERVTATGTTTRTLPVDTPGAIPMGPSLKRPRILIAGLGNILLKDDGVGVHAVRELWQDPPPGALVVEVGTAVLDALHLFEWAEGILAIDAMRTGGSPGTIYSLGVKETAEPGPMASLHELSLLGALRFLPDHRPAITILGVEPESIDYGLDLSPSLQTVMPKLVQLSKEIVACWETVFDRQNCREYSDFPKSFSNTLLRLP